MLLRIAIPIDTAINLDEIDQWLFENNVFEIYDGYNAGNCYFTFIFETNEQRIEFVLLFGESFEINPP